MDVRLDPKNPPSTVDLPVPVSTAGSDGLVARVIGDRLELKMTASSSSSAVEERPLLDASQLNELRPASFICTSCSLPLINCRNADSTEVDLAFADLPSEYWSELVEAWMCHSEQKLSGDVVKQSKGGTRGIRPSPSQALVGGSYLLVDASVVKEGNVRIHPKTKVRFHCFLDLVVPCFSVGILHFYSGYKESHRRSPTGGRYFLMTQPREKCLYDPVSGGCGCVEMSTSSAYALIPIVQY